jgi:hypothetical protein
MFFSHALKKNFVYGKITRKNYVTEMFLAVTY